MAEAPPTRARLAGSGGAAASGGGRRKEAPSEGPPEGEERKQAWAAARTAWQLPRHTLKLFQPVPRKCSMPLLSLLLAISSTKFTLNGGSRRSSVVKERSASATSCGTPSSAPPANEGSPSGCWSTEPSLPGCSADEASWTKSDAVGDRPPSVGLANPDFPEAPGPRSL